MSLFSYKLIASLAALLILTAPSHSDDLSARRSLAREMVKETGATEQLKAALPLIIHKLGEVYVTLYPKLKPDLDLIEPRMQKKMQDKLGDLELAIAEVYAAHFTENELKEIIAFIKLPSASRGVQENRHWLEVHRLEKPDTSRVTRSRRKVGRKDRRRSR